MSKVLIYVEGQTEEGFVHRVLAPHLVTRDVFVIPKLAVTHEVADGPDVKGGITSYGKVKREIRQLLRDTSATMVTTMLDYYGLPASFPGKSSVPAESCFDRVAHLEEEFRKDVGHPRFRPYLQLHEFEALVFVDPAELARAFRAGDVELELRKIRSSFGSPEEIDDDAMTAPSKRLARLLPEYLKAYHGPLVTARIGLAKIRNECRHFGEWVAALEQLGPG